MIFKAYKMNGSKIRKINLPSKSYCPIYPNHPIHTPFKFPNSYKLIIKINNPF